jgi:hypothetical protein
MTNTMISRFLIKRWGKCDFGMGSKVSLIKEKSLIKDSGQIDTSTRHQEIQGVGYAHHTCGRRPWVRTRNGSCASTPINSRTYLRLAEG